jgi:hypothetical protein
VDDWGVKMKQNSEGFLALLNYHSLRDQELRRNGNSTRKNNSNSGRGKEADRHTQGALV